jgi:hypothetical protein
LKEYGEYIVAPALIHPNGNVYKFAGGDEVFELTKEQLLDLMCVRLQRQQDAFDTVQQDIGQSDRQTIQLRATQQLLTTS